MLRTLAATVSLLCLMTSSLVQADDRDYRRGEYKEKFRSGGCEVEREQKRDGEYKEERKCKGGPRGYEQKQKYREGPCLIEREWKRDGEFEEKIECKRW
ncbi:hypothetical protein HTY52_06800 [Cupriavidus taiwanensis]|uniref:hypothetical protein n=1 Tax=Cupriavidus taiwanensis TaxID=164546 RepID=UPI00157263C8|nr:hypothetical protein [Cupriavidus taiwanensis]